MTEPEETGSTIPAPEVETPPTAKGIKDKLADAGFDIKDLYESTIPGTDITFGQAKDAAPDIADVSRLKLDVEQQRDTLVKQHTDERQEMQALYNRMVDKFGNDAVAELVAQVPDDMARSAEFNRTELVKWLPELSESAPYDAAMDQIAKRAEFYGIPRQFVDGAATPIKRVLLRLDKLESYLDDMRKPVEPAKKVSPQPAKAVTSGKKKPVKKFDSPGKQRVWEQLTG
ncbi:MAG: hypothetical protein GY758_01050 [Fuerstiella sp.]|nr:hypothetical protein [Fuerstiella sp.]